MGFFKINWIIKPQNYLEVGGVSKRNKQHSKYIISPSEYFQKKFCKFQGSAYSYILGEIENTHLATFRLCFWVYTKKRTLLLH